MLGLIRPGTTVGGVDLLRCGRAPGASTYIRQLRDGLPQSCMHSTDDRGDGFILFAGAKDANRILETRHPASGALFRVPKLEEQALTSCRASSPGRGEDHALGNEPGFDVAPERDRELARHRDQHDAPDPA